MTTTTIAAAAASAEVIPCRSPATATSSARPYALPAAHAAAGFHLLPVATARLAHHHDHHPAAAAPRRRHLDDPSSQCTAPASAPTLAVVAYSKLAIAYKQGNRAEHGRIVTGVIEHAATAASNMGRRFHFIVCVYTILYPRTKQYTAVAMANGAIGVHVRYTMQATHTA